MAIRKNEGAKSKRRMKELGLQRLAPVLPYICLINTTLVVTPPVCSQPCCGATMSKTITENIFSCNLKDSAVCAFTLRAGRNAVVSL